MKNLSLCLMLALIFMACKNDKTGSAESYAEYDAGMKAEKLTGSRSNLNLSVFIDLSDRISPIRNPNPTMEQWKQDLGYINSITSAFETHLQNKKIVLMDDYIKLFFHPTPLDIPDINELVTQLDKGFNKDNVTRESVSSINSDYSKYGKILYETTLEQKEPKAEKGIDDYPGSDIYGFFKSRVKDYCIKDGYRNVLIILTDGYEYYKDGNPKKDKDHKSNYLLSKSLREWGINQNNYKVFLEEKGYGFKVPTTGLEDLEVYIIGIAPKESWQLDVLNHYWINWLKEMGVKNFQGENAENFIKQTDLPANLDKTIKGFIYEEYKEKGA